MYTIFSNSPKTAAKNLKLTVGDDQLEKEENPVYLGVTLDRQMKYVLVGCRQNCSSPSELYP